MGELMIRYQLQLLKPSKHQKLSSSANFRQSSTCVHILPWERHQENGDALRDRVLAQTHRRGQLFGRHGGGESCSQRGVWHRHHGSQLHGKRWVREHGGVSLFCHSHFRYGWFVSRSFAFLLCMHDLMLLDQENFQTVILTEFIGLIIFWLFLELMIRRNRKSSFFKSCCGKSSLRCMVLTECRCKTSRVQCSTGNTKLKGSEIAFLLSVFYV